MSDYGNIEVEALIDGVTDNGRRHRKGERFRMDESLVGPHERAGQVAVVRNDDGNPPKPPAKADRRAKQQTPPRDKQQRGGQDKT